MEVIRKKNVIIFIRLINHEMYVQKMNEKSLSPFHDKLCYGNKIKSIPGVHLNPLVKSKP